MYKNLYATFDVEVYFIEKKPLFQLWNHDASNFDNPFKYINIYKTERIKMTFGKFQWFQTHQTLLKLYFVAVIIHCTNSTANIEKKRETQCNRNLCDVLL